MSQWISKASRSVVSGCALGLAVAGGFAGAPENTPATSGKARQQVTQPERFYCNIKALTPAERARHKQLTAKLLAARADTVETEKGYEFQYRAGSVTLAELAQWVATESKCCPFFDFHIDLENEGQLFCLRLTGRDGIKTFIRAEFHLDAKKG